MEPILTIDNLNSFGGNMLRQGDRSQLKYRLRDVGNKNLGISGKSCEIKMYGRDYTTVVYETTATVSTENTVSFTIDKVLPKGTFYLEFTVGDYIFPTDHREFFEITPSGKGIEANVIEIVGVDAVVKKAVDLINDDPSLIIDEDKLVTDIISNTGIGNIEEYYQQFSDVITDLSEEKDYHSLPEISAARGGHDTLGDRLDETTAQLAQKADRTQVDTFEARMEDIIQSSDLDPNKDQEVVDARLGRPTLGSKIQELDGLINRLNLISHEGEDYTWESGVYGNVDGDPYDYAGRIRVVDYLEVGKNDIVSTGSNFNYYVIMYDDEFSMIGSIKKYIREDYVIENEAVKYIRPIIKIHDSTEPTSQEIAQASSSFRVYKTTTDAFNYIKKEVNLNRLNLISHKGEDYTWESGVYGNLDGEVYDYIGRIRTTDYIEVDKDDIISTDSSFDYYVIMYDDAFNMIGSIKKYIREDYVIENEAVKYIRPIIKINDSTEPTSQEIAYATSSFRVYTRTANVFKEQSSGTGRGYKVKIGGIGQIDADITSADGHELTLASIKSLRRRQPYKDSGSQKITQMPVGYLYHAPSGSGLTDLYYAPNQADKPKKIGNMSLDFNYDLSSYQSAIGEDGEIIWVHEKGRKLDGSSNYRVRVHDSGDYSNPQTVDLPVTPIAWLQNCGIDFAFDEDGNEYCIFGEYIGERHGDLHLWKVTKPYSDPANWKTVLTKTQSTSWAASDRDIWHFHTANYDPYTGVWYATSGDTDAETHWWYSTDEGESWTELLDGTYWESQVARVLNFVFTEDYIYWGNDYGTNHSLNRVARGANGVIDPTTRVKLAELNKNQSTYATALLHSPPGLLMYDRVDTEFGPNTNTLEVQFYSFDDKKVHTLATLERDPSKPNSFFGLRCKTYTLYQGIYDTKMIVGFGTSPNWLVLPYNDTERRTTLTFDIY